MYGALDRLKKIFVVSISSFLTTSHDEVSKFRLGQKKSLKIALLPSNFVHCDLNFVSSSSLYHALSYIPVPKQRPFGEGLNC